MSIFPTLAPREGGSDAGLDGLIAESGGASMQLICTVGEDVLDNLTRSIRSNQEVGGESKACILATSRRLTNSQKRSLENRARELGRPLRQIYDQPALAELLYHNPRWCKELLGITGDARCLAVFPVTRRPLLSTTTIGRESEQKFILESTEDLLIVGQPGAGKTHLLFNCAKRARGRFIVLADRVRLAPEIRELKPAFVVLDDAYGRLEFLAELLQLRAEIRGGFRIIAACWPGQEIAVTDILGVHQRQIVKLQPLAQGTILKIIEAHGILGPPRLLHELIHQSHGKPGLAVLLCSLCHDENLDTVVLGTALANDIRLFLERLVGKEAIMVLACFAIGGTAGMSVDSVAKLMDVSSLKVREITTQLAAAGIVQSKQEHRIAIYPDRLRQALVRDVFLKPPFIDLEPFISNAPDLGATISVIIQAIAIGGSAFDDLIRRQLAKLGDAGSGAFIDYAWLGSTQAKWVIENYPHRCIQIAEPALKHCPAVILQALLSQAADRCGQESPTSNHRRAGDVIPDISRWILGAQPDSDEFVGRRKQLLNALNTNARALTCRSVVCAAAELIISIRYEATSIPPGERNTITLERALVIQPLLSKVAALWEGVVRYLSELDASEIPSVVGILHEWVHPKFHGGDLPPTYIEECRHHATSMLTTLLSAYAGKWTHHYHLHDFASKLNLQSLLHVDPLAAILYPSPDCSGDWRTFREGHLVKVGQLAESLALQDPPAVVTKLTAVCSEAALAGITSAEWPARISEQLALLIETPTEWLIAMLAVETPAYLVEPILTRLVNSSLEQGQDWALRFSKVDHLMPMVVGIALKHYQPDSELWHCCQPHFERFEYMIGILALRKELPVPTMQSLLRMASLPVARIVAIRMWQSESEPRIPTQCFEVWKEAILQVTDSLHQLVDIFSTFPAIGFDWLQCRLQSIDSESRSVWFGAESDMAIAAAVSSLSAVQRMELLAELPTTEAVAELVEHLVGQNLEVFLHLLRQESLGEMRLVPLRIEGDPPVSQENVVPEFTPAWQSMAIAAMDHGFSPRQIFLASQAGGFSWSGSTSSMFRARAIPFQTLLDHDDERIREVGKIGYADFMEHYRHHLAAEGREEVFG